MAAGSGKLLQAESFALFWPKWGLICRHLALAPGSEGVGIDPAVGRQDHGGGDPLAPLRVVEADDGAVGNGPIAISPEGGVAGPFD